MRTEPIIVLEAASMTAAMTFAITVYAMTTKTDFTLFGPILYICGFVFATAGIFMACFGINGGILWASLGVILFSFYLVYDTQMIMNGNSKYQYSEDMYILAAVNLYLDIINMFLYILQILS